MARALGIDVGSTSVKGVAIEGDAVVGVAARPLDARLPSPPDRHEEDPERVARVVEAIVAELASPDVDAVSFTGQMHGGLLTDPEGRPLTPMITWQDHRAEGKAKAMRAAARWSGLGTHVHGGFLGPTVRWLHDEGLLPSAPWRLSGVYEWTAARVLGVEPYTDPGSAAAWGLYDIVDGAWCADAVRVCRVPPETLPRVVPGGCVAGVVDGRRLGLGREVRVVSGTGDTQASYIGSGCRPDELLLNVGTGSQLAWETEHFERPHATDVRALPGGRFLVGVPALAGGAAYARLADFVGDVLGAFGHRATRDEVYAVLNDQAGRADAGAAGVHASPLFLGSRWKGGARRAALSGLDGANFTLSNVGRAMLEGMVEELAEVYFHLQPELRTHRALVGAGNAIRRNPLLREVAAARFGLPLRVSPFDEEAALGAARLAAAALETAR